MTRKPAYEELEQIINSVSNHIYFLNKDYICLNINNACLTAHKKSRKEIVGHSVTKLIGKEVFDCLIKEKMDKCLAGKRIHYESWFDFPGSGQRFMDIVYHPYLETSGSVSGIIVVSNDITRRKTAEKALAEKAALLDNILKNAHDIAIATTDLDFRINYYNPVAEKLFGYTAKEVFGKTVQEMHTKENVDPERFEHAVKIIRHDGKYCYSTTQETKNGTRYLDLTVTGIFDSKDKMVGFSLFSRDITEHKKAEETLKQRERYLTGLNEAAQVLLIPANTILFQKFVDKIGPALDASRAYVFMNHTDSNGQLLMSQKAEWCAKGISPEIDNPLLQNLSYDNWMPRWKSMLFWGKIVNDSVTNFPDKEREVLEPQSILAILIVPIMVDNEFVGFIGFDNCISDCKWDTIEQTFLSTAANDLAQAIKRLRSEESIRASLKEKEILLREIHHRVKNNMLIIVSLLNMHSRRTDNTYLGEVFDDCRNRINAMSLIHEALYQSENLAKIDFKVYLNKLCRNLIQAYAATNKGITVTVNQCNVALNMDQGIAVGMVICELVSNTFKHAFPLGKGGIVLINLSVLEGEIIELIVQDNGKGLPPDIDIINPSSLGLRLTVATITRELAGNIEVERDNGTRFVIHFKCKSK